jgi:hypothetical protein
VILEELYGYKMHGRKILISVPTTDGKTAPSAPVARAQHWHNSAQLENLRFYRGVRGQDAP